MKTIYVVYTQDYDDVEIVSAFTEQFHAERYAKEIRKTKQNAIVKEVELDHTGLTQVQAKKFYITRFNIDTGEIIFRETVMELSLPDNYDYPDSLHNMDWCSSDISQADADEKAMKKRQTILTHYKPYEVSVDWLTQKSIRWFKMGIKPKNESHGIKYKEIVKHEYF